MDFDSLFSNRASQSKKKLFETSSNRNNKNDLPPSTSESTKPKQVPALPNPFDSPGARFSKFQFSRKTPPQEPSEPSNRKDTADVQEAPTQNRTANSHRDTLRNNTAPEPDSSSLNDRANPASSSKLNDRVNPASSSKLNNRSNPASSSKLNDRSNPASSSKLNDRSNPASSSKLRSQQKHSDSLTTQNVRAEPDLINKVPQREPMLKKDFPSIDEPRPLKHQSSSKTTGRAHPLERTSSCEEVPFNPRSETKRQSIRKEAFVGDSVDSQRFYKSDQPASYLDLTEERPDDVASEGRPLGRHSPLSYSPVDDMIRNNVSPDDLDLESGSQESSRQSIRKKAKLEAERLMAQVPQHSFGISVYYPSNHTALDQMYQQKGSLFEDPSAKGKLVGKPLSSSIHLPKLAQDRFMEESIEEIWRLIRNDKLEVCQENIRRAKERLQEEIQELMIREKQVDKSLNFLATKIHLSNLDVFSDSNKVNDLKDCCERISLLLNSIL